MIDYIAGILESAEIDNIVVESGGVGYKIFIAPFSFGQMPAKNSFVKIYIVEAVAGMYGGVINLYGFLTKEERETFLLIKDEVPGTGAKKALEYTDKVSKSFADFKTAVAEKNSAMLTGVFGFTKKTADKLIAALKDKISALNVTGGQKWGKAAQVLPTGIVLEAVSALVALGCKAIQSQAAVNQAYLENPETTLEDLIKKSLNVYKD
jgi:Holliday junction DNA helicase RuvA